MKTAALILGSVGVAAYAWDQIIVPFLDSAPRGNVLLGGIGQAAPCLLCGIPISDNYILIAGILLIVLALFVL
jgi:hypothetical protein